MSSTSSVPLSFSAGVNTTGFDKGISSILDSVRSLEQGINRNMSNAVSSINAVENSFKKLSAAVGIAFTIDQAADFVKQIRDVRAEIQSFEVSFETLLGSKSKADALFGSIREFAVNTPMQLKDLASAAQMMLSFNIGQDKIMPYLKALGDISMGDTQKFQSLSLAFSQMSSAGKLMGQDLMQMINAGFNPLAVMSEKTGKSISKLKDEMSAGSISAEMVQQAFIDATSAGGKYFGMLEKQSKGIAGAMSNLQGAIDDMFNEMGEASEGIMTEMYGMATAIVKDWKAIGVAIASAAAAYGVYKAAVMADTAIKTTIGAAQYEAEVEGLTRVIAAKEAGANADIEAAAASGHLTAAKAQEIISLRAEASAVVESLQAKAQQAAADLAAADAAEKSAHKQYLAAVEVAEAKQAQLLAAERSGDMFAISAAQAEADAAANDVNAAATARDAAAKDLKAKEEAAAAAATNAETAATNLDTAAQNGNAVATTKLSAAKAKLLAVLRKVYTMMLANPWVIGIAAVTALGYAIYKLVTHESEEEKMMNRLKKAHEQFNEAVASETAQIDILFARLESATKGSKEYDGIKDEIISKYGTYLDGMKKEISTLEDVAGAYRAVRDAALEAAKARQISDVTKSETTEFAKKESEAKKKLKTLLESKYGNKTDKDGLSLVEKYYWQIVSSKAFDPSSTKKMNQEFIDQFNRTSFQGLQGQDKKTINPLQDILDELQSDRQIMNRAIDEAEQIYGKNPFAEKAEEEAITYGEKYEEAKKRWEETGKKLAEMQAAKDKYSDKEYEKAKADHEEATKNFKKWGGDTSNKTATAGYQADSTAESLGSIQNKQARERKRLAEDLELELWQARIDAGEYGNKAYLQQMALDHQKEQQQLQRQMEDAITAEIARQKAIWDKKEELAEKEAKARGGTYTRKAFNSDNLSAMEFTPGTTFTDEKIGDVEMADIYAISQRYAEMMKGLIATQQHTRAQLRKQEKEDMDEYLAQWGTYEQKRQALTDIANRKMSEATTIGQRQAIAAQLDQDLEGLRAEDLKKSIDWESLFGDEATQSVEVLRYNLDKLKTSFDANKASMSATEIKDYQEAITRLENEIAARNPFAALHKSITDISTSKSEFITACDEYKTAQEELNTAQQEFNDALAYQRELEAQKDENGNPLTDTAEYAKAVEATAAATTKLTKAEDKATQSENKMLKARSGITSAYQNFANNLRSAGSVVTDLGSKAKNLASVFSSDIANSIGKALDFMDEIFDATGNVLNSLKDAGIGISGQIKDTTEQTTQGVEQSAKASANAISTVEKASVILAVISAALQVATAIANLFNNDKAHEKEIERLQRRIDQLQWELDNEETVLLQNRVGKAIDKLRLIYSQAEAQVLALHNVTSRWPEWAQGLAKTRYQGEIYKRTIEGLADAYAKVEYTADKALGTQKWMDSRKQLENYSEQILLLKKQNEEEQAKKDKNWDSIQENNNKIEEYGQKMAELLNDIMEEIIGYSAEDLASQLGDAFIEAAKAGEDAMEAWGDKTNEIVADIMKRMLITKMLEDPIGEIFNNYKDKWFKDGQFKGIDAVINSMQDFSNDLQNVGSTFNEFWNSLDEQTKNMLGGDAEREGTSRGIATASQESVDENNARLTTIQGHTYTLVQGMADLNRTSNAILERVTGIERNTTQANEKLDDMGKAIRNINASIDDIQSRGIKLKS